MIRAVIFDLDGTLVQTERLKARSYAQAAIQLCPYNVSEEELIEGFKDVVGLSRREVAKGLLERFDLEPAARDRMAEFGVSKPWQAFVQVRLQIYNALLDDPEVLRNNQWPHNVGLLHKAREQTCKTALATMSGCRRTTQVLQVLGLRDEFDFVATRDDVENGKPDPAIYLLVSKELDIPPAECLVIEDSPSGVKAAQAAEMHVVAVSTPFTRQHLEESNLFSKDYLITDPHTLLDTVAGVMERERTPA